MKILGVDYGRKKIGLAISEGEIAEPLAVVSPKNWLLALNEFCQRQEIEKIVIGISEGKMAEETRRFGEKIQKLTGVPVVFHDETLTSIEAKKKMIEAKKGKRKRKKEEDAVAAALILQSFLENQ